MTTFEPTPAKLRHVVRQPRREHWDDFVAKLADTFDFGTKASLPAIGGGRVIVRVPKFNVVPVMIAT